ncbi:SOUL family heme-binding protein [Aureimonas leprariae]|uniref:Heme-binding protein n=1 Tax=Plantimonas leprariae TaxID=2615207 RepID=A0A7V7PQQ0_9HYPH|nr:heme-binding protein [Aureimonas leprariae]KAB0680736.1 heme-binding protein [Aureimonas leprariae]
MFRHKSTAYDRLTDAISDIGERIAELEHNVAERVSPTPSVAERARRSVAQYLPGHQTGLYRYLPDFARGWQLPSTDDARSAYNSAYGTTADTLSDLRSQLSDWASHLPSWRRVASETRSRLPDARLPRYGSFRRGMQTQRGVDRLRDNDTLTTVLIVGGAVVAIGGAAYVAKKFYDHTEEPDYDVVRRDGDIEVRDYDAMVVAETVKSGYHEKARKDGYLTLSDYISAHNRPGKKITMTVPVLQQLSESEGQTKGWAIRFVMPKKYSTATLPAPGGNDVRLKDVAPKRVVAIRFNGNFSASLASKKLMTLYNYIADENLKQKGDPEYAFYNPPLVPGFLKRNEILIEIER